MSNAISRFFAPPAAKPRLPDAEVNRLYPKLRWRVFEATFLGYAFFYLVRNNFSAVAPDMQHALNYSNVDIGLIGGILSITYGIGKFTMGAISDRSNARVFMAVGLLLTSICNFGFGASHNFNMHMLLWGLNGFFQGMGWPPCGRTMGHWFSEKERGFTFSAWNTSHNVGGAIAGALAAYAVVHFGGWQYAFYVPGAITAVASVYLFLRLVDTPQSKGLPSVEEYKNDFTALELKTGKLPERELTYKELFIDNVLLNKWVWLLAVANFFAYVSRYGMLDWGPKYLREVKGADIMEGSGAIAAIEIGGIVPTIFLGWVSDKLGGRRGAVATLCMLPIIIVFALLIYLPTSNRSVVLSLLFIVGFCIYPVINLITIMALDLTSKKAIGTAAGFIGMLGYLGRSFINGTIGWILDHFLKYGKIVAWTYAMWVILACSVIAMALLAFTWNQKPRT